MEGSFLSVLLANLQQAIPKESPAYLTQETAYLELKRYSKQDFGYDVEAWEAWCNEEEARAAADIEKFYDENNITSWAEYKRLRKRPR